VVGNLLVKNYRQRRYRKDQGIKKAYMLDFPFPICHQVFVMMILENWNGVKKFGFYQFLAFVECRTHRQVQQEEQEQRGSKSGFPSYH